MKNITVIFIASVLALSGCATWNELIERRKANDPYDGFDGMTNADIEAYNADPSNTDKIICKKEPPIGSAIPIRTCLFESVIEARSNADQRAVEEILRNTPPPTP